MTNLLRNLTDDADLWIYVADRSLSSMEQRTLQSHLEHFVTDWNSHGRTVCSEFLIANDRFVIIGAEIPDHEISGCGIDKSVHILQEAADAMGFQWLSGLDVLFVGPDGEIQSASRADFRRLADQGDVTSLTTVFDLSIRCVGDLRSGRFRKAATDSWHGRAFDMRDPEAETRWAPSRT